MATSPQSTGNYLPLGNSLLVTDAKLGAAADQHVGHILHQGKEQLQLDSRVTAGKLFQQGAQPGQMGVIVNGQGQP
ncbi:hypothetical protein AE1304_10750 [Aeromonas enteropelogenes]